MRDVGFLIWIVLLFVGVGGSIVSSIRKQAQRSAPTMAARRRPQREAAQMPQPLTAPPRETARPAPQRTVRPRPAPSTAPSAPPPLFADNPHRRTQRLFDNNRDLVRAVIAAEVLGKPRGLADEYPFR